MQWKKCEHNWSDTSIYDEDGNQVCTKSIHEEATEETQDEMDKKVQADFNLIVAAPDMLEALRSIENDDGRIPESIWHLRNEAITKAEGRRN